MFDKERLKFVLENFGGDCKASITEEKLIEHLENFASDLQKYIEVEMQNTASVLNIDLNEFTTQLSEYHKAKFFSDYTEQEIKYFDLPYENLFLNKTIPDLSFCRFPFTSFCRVMRIDGYGNRILKRYADVYNGKIYERGRTQKDKNFRDRLKDRDCDLPVNFVGIWQWRIYTYSPNKPKYVLSRFCHDKIPIEIMIFPYCRDETDLKNQLLIGIDIYMKTEKVLISCESDKKSFIGLLCNRNDFEVIGEKHIIKSRQLPLFEFTEQDFIRMDSKIFHRKLNLGEPKKVICIKELSEFVKDKIISRVTLSGLKNTVNDVDWELFQNFLLSLKTKDFYHDVAEEGNCSIDEAGKEFDKLLDFANTYSQCDFLKEVYISQEKYQIIADSLQTKKNIILQGAPGVGKTFAAKRLAYSIIGEKNDSQIEFVQFHQNYSYEDFIMGWRPTENNFELRRGIFYNFCKKAEAAPDKKFFFIIDEINRGNMSKIFGELLMLIEADKRGNEKIKLAYNDENFSVPENLFIIGMMNTADRSLAIIDYALRRRFSFFEMTPAFDSDGFKKYQSALNSEIFDKLVDKIKILNEKISADNSLGAGFCIGHSYFCGLENCDEKILRSIVDYEILPMLQEYYFDDSATLQDWENILRGVFDE